MCERVIEVLVFGHLLQESESVSIAFHCQATFPDTVKSAPVSIRGIVIITILHSLTTRQRPDAVGMSASADLIAFQTMLSLVMGILLWAS